MGDTLTSSSSGAVVVTERNTFPYTQRARERASEKANPEKKEAEKEKYPENQLRFNLGLKFNLTGSCA